MLKNYLKVAIRSLVKQRVYSVINILGLSVGVASCLLIIMYVLDEFSFDQFHEKADRIYKVALERKYPSHITNYAIIPHSYADVIRRDFPEVASTVKMAGPINNVVVNYTNAQNEVKQFEENFIMAADSNFFEVFSIKLINGDKQTVLTKPNDVVVTEETAKRYFGDAQAVGKTIKILNRDFTVTGVCENIPDNSHFKFDFLAKWDDQFFGGGLQTNFITFTSHVYVELRPGTDPKALEAKFPKMVDTYASAQIERDLGKSWEDYKRDGNGYRYFLQPLTKIHLDPINIEGKMRTGGNIHYVYFLISIASLILVIACINFMNLATARSAERAREVGVRKAMGSLKGQLVSQFLVESIVLSLFSTFLAIGIVQIALPFFNNLADKHLSFSLSPGLMLSTFLISIAVGFLAGSYPAFALSSINPVVVMKGNFSSSIKGAWLRNGLVVFQFCISIILIVGTLIVSRQMEFMRNKSLGFDKDHILVIERVFALQNKTQTFLDELRRIPGVEQAGGTFSLLGRQNDFFGAQFLPEGSNEILTTKGMGIDDDFANAVGFEFVEGHGYSKETNDSLSIILNETAVRTLGLKDPIGKKLTQIQRTPNGNIEVSYRVIGVIRDFNFQSLHDPITPLAIQSVESFGGGSAYAMVRTKESNIGEIVSAAEEKWKLLAPDQPFKYSFLDQDLTELYHAEKTAGQVFAIFSILAIVIACVGLFGLAAYTASLRTKEIGIRKVLGASVTGMVLLLSKEFTKLILIAFCLSVPAAWYMMDLWLSEFAYRTEIGAGVFIFAGLAALVISWITVSYQSIKAAVVNPIKSLRSE